MNYWGICGLELIITRLIQWNVSGKKNSQEWNFSIPQIEQNLPFTGFISPSHFQNKLMMHFAIRQKMFCSSGVLLEVSLKKKHFFSTLQIMNKFRHQIKSVFPLQNEIGTNFCYFHKIHCWRYLETKKSALPMSHSLPDWSQTKLNYSQSDILYIFIPKKWVLGRVWTKGIWEVEAELPAGTGSERIFEP